MHWGQIKTLLILSFFVLDIYLFMQFLDKKEVSDIAVLEQQSSSIEDQLKNESITVKNLPEQEYEESFISVKQKNFTEEELAEFSEVKKQKTFIFQHAFIVSKLNKPEKVSETASEETISNLMKDTIYYPEEYTFWNWNKEKNIIIFFQNKMGRPVYYNQNGIVLFFLNDENEVEYYTQTMLGEAEAISENQKLIKPMRAVEELYDGNQLYSGDTISSVDIGFHTRVPFESGVQVFAPIWKVNVNKEQNYFVNAIEGFTFSSNEMDFLNDTIQSNISRMEETEKKDKTIDDMLEDLHELVEDEKDNEVRS